jgi:hypothetical protein
MNRRIIAVAGVTVLMLFAEVANAESITYSNNLTSLFNIDNQSLLIPKFDTALGTLNSVSVTASVNTFGEVGLENTNPTSPISNRHFKTFYIDPDLGPQTTHGQLGLTFDSQSLANVSWDVSNDYTLNLSIYDGNTDYAGTSGFEATYVDTTDSQVINYSLAADLAKFTGTGNVDFIANGSAYSVLVTPSGNVSTFMSTKGTANVSLTYGFSPVPEPATFVMLAVGTMCMLAYAWRRRLS